MYKHATRKDLLARRKQMSPSECLHASRRVQRRLLDSESFRQAAVLALYSPVNNEVHTEELFQAARQAGKRVCFPKVKAERLGFYSVENMARLTSGFFGVAEPPEDDPVPATEIDLLVVPGVAFDRRGHRLGYGKGFYDRELADTFAEIDSVGLCFDFQLCERLPEEEHDQPVCFLATESEFLSCHNAVAGSP